MGNGSMPPSNEKFDPKVMQNRMDAEQKRQNREVDETNSADSESEEPQETETVE